MTFDKVTNALHALPVASISGAVRESVNAGKVTVLAAPTGSGKSMLVPAQLADDTNEQVVVLVPRRFLAIDAASNVAQLAESEIGSDVGYAIGEMAGEKSKFSDNTKLLFVTYGYAISSGLINRANVIVLDEVHEAAEDISLARAILHERKQHDPDLKLLEMSATVDASRQSAYWRDVAETATHNVEGQSLVCEERRITPGRDGSSIAQTAIDLMQHEGRNGIAIFRSSIKDVEQTVEELQNAAKRANMPDLEIAQIYGGTPADERAAARRAPQAGGRKIIVGTNVIESGVNLRWVDAAISDGMGKIPYDRLDTGAHALVLEDLPQWRVVQQRGRVNRAPDVTGFNSGIFILYSNKEMAQRPQQATPELERRDLTQIAFRAASLGYNPEHLHFDAAIDPKRMQEAKENLIRLGLLEEDWSLTKDGKYAAKLPLSPATAAICCEAQRMDIAAMRSQDPKLRARPKLLPDAIILAALIEQGNLRENYKRGHGLEGKSDVHGGSDVLDGLKAYLQLERTAVARIVADSAKSLAEGDPTAITVLEAAREKLKEECAKLNVSYTDFNDIMMLVGEIRARHPDARALAQDANAPFDAPRYNALKQAILQGYAHSLFQLQIQDDQPTYRDLLRDYGNARNAARQPFNGYEINEYSALQGAQASSHTPLLVGTLRELPPKRGALADAPLTVIDLPTSIPTEVFLNWAIAHEPALLSHVHYERKGQGGELSARYAGRAEFNLTIHKHTPLIAAQISQLDQPGHAHPSHYGRTGR